MYTAEQAFCLGFLARCAEEGVSPDERLQKVAELQKQGGTEWRTLLSPLVGGAALGIGGGYMLANMMPEDLGKIKRPEFVDELQQEELLNTYRQQSEQLRSRAATVRRMMERQRKQKRSPFGI